MFGRCGLLRKLKTELAKSRDGKPLFWIHCASLGEFEQGRPIIERYRERYPNHKILLTFFSPSGYEIRKNYDQVDYVSYLPLDFSWNARNFVKLVQPQRVVFVKYEFWQNYLKYIKKSGAQLYIVSAIFRPNQWFFRKIGFAYRKFLFYYDHIFVQNQQSVDLLNAVGMNRVTLTGDTRFDRVADIVRQVKPQPFLATFIKNQPSIIVGSSWFPDEQLFVDLHKMSRDKNFRLIVVPHEIHKRRIRQLQNLFPASLLWTEQELYNPEYHTVLIVNTIGLLSSLYQYATIAYIGGGFGVGIHNILEPVSYGVPVIFGPNYRKFQEAVALIALQGARTINTAEELGDEIETLLNHKDLYNVASQACKEYTKKNIGSTAKILDFISQHSS